MVVAAGGAMAGLDMPAAGDRLSPSRDGGMGDVVKKSLASRPRPLHNGADKVWGRIESP